MTHSGGMPHAVGDRGQRYEVRCRNLHGDNTTATFGWAGTLAGAATMVRSIELHPSWHSPEVIDRRALGIEDALRELVRLKDVHDRLGMAETHTAEQQQEVFNRRREMQEDYDTNKPKAWAQARAVLAIDTERKP